MFTLIRNLANSSICGKMPLKICISANIIATDVKCFFFPFYLYIFYCFLFASRDLILLSCVNEFLEECLGANEVGAIQNFMQNLYLHWLTRRANFILIFFLAFLRVVCQRRGFYSFEGDGKSFSCTF